MLRAVIAASFLLRAAAQSCAWANGSVSVDYAPCNPTAATSSCCLKGESCLSSGLCYGGLGLVYRGACSGGWHNGVCPDYCLEASDMWVNLYPCSFPNSGTDGPQNFWCGANATACEAGKGTFLDINPGDAVYIIPNTTSTETPEAGAARATTTVTATAIVAAAANAQCTRNRMTEAAVGAGVGAPFALLSAIMLVLYLVERKRRIQSTATISNDVASPQDYPYRQFAQEFKRAPDTMYEVGGKMMPQEMPT